MNPTELRAYIRDVPDFPKPGILFRDITPLLADSAAFRETVRLLGEKLRDAGAEELLAVESRGFIFGAALALALDLPLHLVRKRGKLPRATVGRDYELEYGTDRVELHHDVIRRGIRYGMVDDLIATGGTAAACTRLVQDHEGLIACCAFVIELTSLDGRERLPGLRVESLIRFD
jgi:adenine phosphoribosyltransferase